MVRGGREPEAERLQSPAKVREFTKNYLEEQDRVQSFLTEHCEFGEGMRVSSVTLYHAYREGNEDAKETWFHGQMKVKGFLKKKIRLWGGGASQGYDGFRMRKYACVDELDG